MFLLAIPDPHWERFRGLLTRIFLPVFAFPLRLRAFAVSGVSSKP